MSLPEVKPITVFSSSSKSLVNPEISKIKKDFLSFQNDMLRDIRKLDEKLDSKLAEQRVINTEQIDAYDKKLDILLTQITKVNSRITNNNDFSEKINDFQLFKSKTEENFNVLNSKINLIQKEYKISINDIENIINDNLRYPGIIGNNAKFINLRRLIDFILKSFKDLNDFKNEIRSYDFDEFKKKTNAGFKDIRFAINDIDKRCVHLIEKKIKEFDTKLNDLIKQNKNIMEENKNLFNEMKNKIDEYFSAYQTKFFSLEKNINDKFVEQLSVIEELKIMKNKFIQEVANIKTNYDSHKKSNEINEKNKENNFNIKNANIYKSKSHSIIKEEKESNNNINSKEINDFQNDNISHQKINQKQKREKSKSFENSPDNKIYNKNFDLRNLKAQKIFSTNNEPILNNKKNILKKELIKNNYSITRISDIKIRKVNLLDSLSRINRNQTIQISGFFSANNMESRPISSNISLISPKKNFNTINKNSFNNNINNNNKDKKKSMHFLESARMTNKITERNLNKDLNALKIINAKTKNFTLNSFNKLKREKKRSRTFQINENTKDQQIQIDFTKTFNNILTNKEIIFVNSRNSKNKRKIQLY